MMATKLPEDRTPSANDAGHRSGQSHGGVGAEPVVEGVIHYTVDGDGYILYTAYGRTGTTEPTCSPGGAGA